MANPATSILNPAGEEILLFYVDADQRLALDHIPVDSEKPVDFYDPQGTPHGPHVTNQSIAAVSLRGLPVVFGQLQITTDSGEAVKKTLVLAQLSPIVKVMAGKKPEETTFDENYTAFAAISNQEGDKVGTHAWCYFVKIRSKEGTTVKLSLEEASIIGNDVKIHHFKDQEIPSNLMPGVNSRLAALYLDKTHREVYYQVEDPTSNSIYCYRVGSSSPPTKVPGTQYAMRGTPIAVTKSKAGNVYLYYLSKPGEEGYANIQRTARVKSEWQETASIKSEFDFAVSTVLETQLAVTQVTVEDQLQNTVFYIGASEEQYKPVRDKGGIQ